MIPPGGIDCFGAGFLPAAYQGSLFRERRAPRRRPHTSRRRDRPRPALPNAISSEELDAQAKEKYGTNDPLEAAIANYELAFRMQTAVPDLTDLAKETDKTKALYGLDDPKTETFGRQCLIARGAWSRRVCASSNCSARTSATTAGTSTRT